ncbi:MAG TPA: hypothetical protein VMJ31_05900, partial [Methylocystis sp.]|nr:hypothetical protein [Methylocystis sp.]
MNQSMSDQPPRIRIFQAEDTAPGHAVIHLGGVARAPLDESFTVARADDEPLAPGSSWPQGPRQPLSSEWHEERQLLELQIGPDVVHPIQGGTPVLLRFPGLGREETVIWPDDLMLQPEGARLWRRPDRRSTRAQVVTPLDGRATPVRRPDPASDAAKADLARKAEEAAGAERRREADALAAKAAAQAQEEQ